MTQDGYLPFSMLLKESAKWPPCPFCKRQAILPLTPAQLKEQPDETTHVCHPWLGGCNHGFAMETQVTVVAVPTKD